MAAFGNRVNIILALIVALTATAVNAGNAVNFCNFKSDGLYADPQDCTKFYQCANGIPSNTQCPGNLVYNPFTFACDWSSNYDCATGTTRSTTTTTSAPPPSLGPSSICAALTDTSTRDPDDCSKFYLCVSGLAYSMACPTGLLFDPLYHRCHWAGQVNCNP